MNRAPFLTQPLTWLRTPRTSASQVDQACAIHRSRPAPAGSHASDLVIACLFVLVVGALATGGAAMTVNLNHPTPITPGPLTAADLADAYNTPVACPPCHGYCDQGRTCPAAAEACTELGAEDVVDDLTRMDRILIVAAYSISGGLMCALLYLLSRYV